MPERRTKSDPISETNLCNKRSQKSTTNFFCHVANFHKEEVDGVENAICTAISASRCNIHGKSWKYLSAVD